MNQEQFENVRHSVVTSLLLPVFGRDIRTMLIAARCVVDYIATGASPVTSADAGLATPIVRNPCADKGKKRGAKKWSPKGKQWRVVKKGKRIVAKLGK